MYDYQCNDSKRRIMQQPKELSQCARALGLIKSESCEDASIRPFNAIKRPRNAFLQLASLCAAASPKGEKTLRKVEKSQCGSPSLLLIYQPNSPLPHPLKIPYKPICKPNTDPTRPVRELD